MLSRAALVGPVVSTGTSILRVEESGAGVETRFWCDRGDGRPSERAEPSVIVRIATLEQSRHLGFHDHIALARPCGEP
jgi:hypothetical protein